MHVPLFLLNKNTFAQIRVPQTSVNMGAYHPKIARLHTGTDQVPSSAPSTAGLMEAVLTYMSTTNEGLDAEDGTITPTPGNPTTGMDVDNDPLLMIRFHYRVLCIMSHVCEQDHDLPSSLITPPPSL